MSRAGITDEEIKFLRGYTLGSPSRLEKDGGRGASVRRKYAVPSCLALEA